MKFMLIALMTFAAFTASAAPKVTVLLRDKVMVGFAPISVRGTYLTEILSNGNVQHTDNKGTKTVVVKISKSAVEKIKGLIANLETSELYGEDTPKCMDAPSSENIVIKNGKEIIIKTQYMCQEKQMAGAYDLNGIIEAASSLHSYLK